MRVDRRAPQAERIARQKLGKEPPRGVVWPVQRGGGSGGGDQRAGQRGWMSGPGAAAGLSPSPQPQQPQGGPPPGNSTAARHHGPGDLCLASWAGLGVLRTQRAAPSPSPLCPEWAPSLLPLPSSWLHVQVVGKILMGSKLISWG